MVGSDDASQVACFLADRREVGVHGDPEVAASRKGFAAGLLLGTRLLTVREAAGILRVCTATVYAMVGRGELRHVRARNVIRIPEDALEALLVEERPPRRGAPASAERL